MDGKILIETIRLRNILSFGNKGERVYFESLNIIIGQNASGKSNLIDVIKLLRSLPKEKGLVKFISENGGITEWIWKGSLTKNDLKKNLNLSARFRLVGGNINYELAFTENLQRINVIDEKFYNGKGVDLFKRNERKVLDNRSIDETLLSDSNLQLNNQLKSDFIFLRGLLLRSVAIYTDLLTNRKSEIRKPQLPDAPNDFLEEDGSNLALVLNDLEHRGDSKDKIVENLRKFNPKIKDYSIRILGGTVQLFIREEGLEKPISAMRLSDGTLRFLCLLAVLCHPEPPPLICIEEPETGLHPDILPTIAELMKDAAQRTQLIVTTHSDILVSAFSDLPEAVLVCEKDADGTHFKRLEAEKLKTWLDEYTLGEAWLRGAIGGTRW